jgi:hypothetical protein
MKIEGRPDMAESEQKLQNRTSDEQHEARKSLVKLFESTPLPTEQLLTNLGLYMRSTILAKILYLNELYTRIVPRPGIVMEFGVWWGQNLALFESFRGVYEPYNYMRKIVGVDTFTGYTAPAAQDGTNDLVAQGQYAVTEEYDQYLTKLLEYHEKENVMHQVKKFELLKGDAPTVTEEYLKKHPETIIALAYFDMQLYEPTKRCLELIKPHLVKGSILAMDELYSWEFPGETIAFREVLGIDRYQMYRSQFLPDRTFVVIE